MDNGTGTALTVDILAAKLSAKADEVAARGSTKAALAVDDDDKCVLFSIPKEELIAAMNPSASGKSEGCTLTAKGSFPFERAGRKYTVTVDLKGGWTAMTVKHAS